MVKNLPTNTGDVCSIPGSGRSPGEGILQYSCLENPKGREARWDIVQGGHRRVRQDLVTK